MDAIDGPRFHERQRLQHCALHALNNLFQAHTCSMAELDAIADQLAPARLPLPMLHPHRTLYLGNWDVNVLELALQRHGKELHWVDLRDLSFAALDLRARWGLLVNVRAEGAVARLLGGRHWFALKQFGQSNCHRWWNLDSLLDAPQLVASSCVGAVADFPGGVAATRQSAATQASCECSDGASDGQEDAEAAAAADSAALRCFLAKQVVERDAKSSQGAAGWLIGIKWVRGLVGDDMQGQQLTQQPHRQASRAAFGDRSALHSSAQHLEEEQAAAPLTPCEVQLEQQPANELDQRLAESGQEEGAAAVLALVEAEGGRFSERNVLSAIQAVAQATNR